MHRIAFIGCAAIGLSIAVSAPAEPLRFGTIDGAGNFSHGREVADCRRQDGAIECPLRRTSFGGLPIDRGVTTLNAAGRVQSLELALGGRQYDVAYRMLVGRYGPPDAAEGPPSWTRFDDGARITMRRAGRDALIAFDFPRNATGAANIGLDGGLAWSLLLLTGLGLAGGYALYRGDKAARGRRGSSAAPSMRDTLERRLRDGRGLRF